MDSRQKTARLNYHIKAKGYDQMIVSKKIGIARITLNRKIQKPESFSIAEVRGLMKTLDLTTEDVADIFLR